MKDQGSLSPWRMREKGSEAEEKKRWRTADSCRPLLLLIKERGGGSAAPLNQSRCRKGLIRTSEWFRVVSDNTGVPEGLPEPPGEVMGLIGPRGEREGCARRWRPPMRSPNWTRRGGAAPLSLSLSLSFLPPSPS